MKWTWTVAVVALVSGCGNKSKSGEPTSASGSEVAASGTPESMLDGSAAGDGASSGAGGASAGEAFVKASFDAKAAQVVSASCSPKKLRLTLDGVLFDTDHDNLQPGADDVLAQVKKVGVDPYPNARIVVEGHTDDVGSDAHNDDSSARRAKTVAAWLASHGVDASRMQTKGYGKRWPRVPNTSDANRSKNRRVEFVVMDQSAGSACSAPNQMTPVHGTGDGAGGGDAHGKGGLGSGSSNGDPLVIKDTMTQRPPGFSYAFPDSAANLAHSCFTYDPSWTPHGEYKKESLDPNTGKFVEHCPSDGVIATCDLRPDGLPSMQWWYAGATDAALDLRKQICTAGGGKWTRATTDAAAPKAQDVGAVAVVCDGHTEAEKKCQEILPNADPKAIQTFKSMCNLKPEPPRCPPGAAVRCDHKDNLTYWYVNDKDTLTMLRASCEQTGGKWATP